ncbi:MAG: acyltransferase [Candidatus Acidiferrales bacterium]
MRALEGNGANRVFIESDVINEAAVGAEVHPARGIERFRSFALAPSGSAHLDLIRAAAAWAVVWGHLRGLFFVDYPEVANHSGWLGAIYFLTGFGHQAVMVFFVLSGFFISSAILRRHATHTWSWRDYAIDRTSRLYVVLIPGLLFGALWDTIGSHRFADTGLYTHPLMNLGYAVARDGLNPKDFVGNLFFLQTIVCRTFGSNAPLWSLANEFWYYVLFPLGLTAGLAWAGKYWRRAIPLTILMLGVAIFVGPGMLIEFLIWLAGFVLAVAYLRLKVSSKAWLIVYLVVSFIVLAISLTAVRTGIPDRRLGNDLIVGGAFALFLFGVLQIGFRTSHLRYARFAHWCAGFSYSLYVLHFPLLLLLRAWLASTQRWQPDGEHLLYGVSIGLVVLTFAWLVSLVTENNTHVARHWMRGTILRESGSPTR